VELIARIIADEVARAARVAALGPVTAAVAD
jgi:hypothetical protein